MPLLEIATEEARSRGRSWVIIGTLIFFFTASVLGVRTFRVHRAAHEALPLTVDSLAILPMVNRTGDAGLDALCDGLTDDLIRQLSQLPPLRLIARTAVQRYRQANPLEAGTALRVGAVMTGELRRTAIIFR